MGSEGAEKIVQEIVRIADVQVKEILQEARTNADGIRGDAEKRALAERQTILTRGQQLAERERQRILADAKIQVKREMSDIKETTIKKAFGKAEEQLKKLVDTPEYVDILKKLIAESGIVVGGGNLEVLVREQDRRLLSEEDLDELNRKITKITKRDTSLSLSDKTIATVGGAVVRSTNGAIEADNTFESRIHRLKNELRFKVAEILFGGAS